MCICMCASKCMCVCLTIPPVQSLETKNFAPVVYVCVVCVGACYVCVCVI